MYDRGISVLLKFQMIAAPGMCMAYCTPDTLNCKKKAKPKFSRLMQLVSSACS
jgi:hypothetical protein